MTGLEKIKDQILKEAKAKAGEKTGTARQKAEKLLRTAREQAEKTERQIGEKSRTDAANYQERIKSSCDLKRRTMMLEAKQEIIAEVIEKAYQTIKSADTKTYFSYMEKLLEQSAQSGQGKMYLSAEDLDRMPEDFAINADRIAKKKGGSLTVEKEPRNLDGGFILVYGGIEENCTWRALFDANREQLQDQVNGYLWRDENG